MGIPIGSHSSLWIDVKSRYPIKNREILIDDWASAMRIAAGTLGLEKEGFILLLEMSLEGSVKISWDMTSPEIRRDVLSGESLKGIVDNMAKLF